MKKQGGRTNGRRVGFETPTKKGGKAARQAKLRMSGKKFKINEPCDLSSSDESARTAATARNNKMGRPRQGATASRTAKMNGRKAKSTAKNLIQKLTSGSKTRSGRVTKSVVRDD